MSRRLRKPYKQGSLDSLCGPYALVNAIHYVCGPLGRDKAVSLLISLLHELRLSYDPVSRLEDGTGIMEMRRLMQSVHLNHPIRWKRPFAKQANIGGKAVWAAIARFLRETGGVVLIDFECVDYGHWTVIRKISATTLTLFDSNGRQYLRRQCCKVVGEQRDRPYTFQPSTAYFLWHDDTHNGRPS